MNRSCIARTLLLTTMAGSAAAAPLHLKTGQVEATALPDVRVVRPADPGFQVIDDAQALPRRTLIQLDGPIDPARRAAIEATGVRILDFIPDNAFVVDTRSARRDAIMALPFVTAAVAYRSEWKVDPTLGQRVYETDAMRRIVDRGQVPAVVTLFPGADPAEVVRRAAGVAVVATHLEADRFVLEVTGGKTALEAMASIDGVSWIENAPEVTFRSNSNNRWVVQSNISNSFPVYDAGIRGEGQLIAVMDGRVSSTHCSFSDPGVAFGPEHRKIQAYNASTGYDLHGTHVAGTALGDAGADTNTRGVAYNARLVFNTSASFGNYASMFNRFALHYSQGAAIHTNSWGNDGTTAYDNWSRAIDTFSWLNDDNLIIFAATNASTLRNPENAKNVLAVGGTNPVPSQASFCTGGIGPTVDGRRKPEIFAPGCSTVSSSGTGCSTTNLSGTSMAAPAIAGAAALARQYYTEGFYPTGRADAADAFVPSGALLKATLLNSAVDMTGVSGYPSNREGWGRVLLDNALYFDGETRATIVRDVRNASADAMSTGDVVEIPFIVNSNAQEVIVTLVWHDAPAASNASVIAVNDLDLEVDAPFDQRYKGNVFAGGISSTGGSADTINNVEMVRIGFAFPGEHTVRIRGTAVNEGVQGYALVISGDVSENTVAGCSDADLAEPYDTLNFFDVTTFLTLFNASDPAADLAAPFGTFNFFDVTTFLASFNAGCP